MKIHVETDWSEKQVKQGLAFLLSKQALGHSRKTQYHSHSVMWITISEKKQTK